MKSRLLKFGRKKSRGPEEKAKKVKPPVAVPSQSQGQLSSRLASLMSTAQSQLRLNGLDAAFDVLSKAVSARQSTGREANLSGLLCLFGQSIVSADPKSALLIAKKALELDNRHPSAWMLAADSQHKLGFKDGAKSAFLVVVSSHRSKPTQVIKASNMLVRYGEDKIALLTGKQAFLSLKRPIEHASRLLYVAQKTADWELAESLTGQIRAAASSGNYRYLWSAPRAQLNWCDDQSSLIGIMRAFSENAVKKVSARPLALEPLSGRRLRIGYISSDFRAHPTARWVSGLLRNHDPQSVEVFLYCTGWDDGSDVRKQILSSVQKAFSLSRMSDSDASALIRTHKLDVLVDLNGPTSGQRLGILASRPAPILVHYIGWPGSLGGRIVDYIVADRYVVPKWDVKSYPESIIWLTSTYQVNNYQKLEATQIVKRSDWGLPEGDFKVIGMFNSIEKVSSTVWSAWMEVLRQVPNSVLWLLNPGQVALEHLSAQAERLGVRSNRIVPALRAQYLQHIARLSLCDVVLDPWPYNGHTTTSDAIFAGVPVITREGKTFASRASGSMLRAAGLEALIANDEKSYVSRAVHLLQDTDELSRLKDFIKTTSRASNLFDAEGKARQLEGAFFHIVGRHHAGQPPVTVDAKRLLSKGPE